VNRPAAEPQADFPSTRERCVSTMTIFEQVPGSRFAEIRTDVLRHRRGDLTPSSALSRHWNI
jgi:hypothetical protein